MNSGFVLLIIILLITSSIPLADQPESAGREDGQFVESFIQFLSLSPDPHLDQAPNVVINGTSGEFNHMFHSSTGETDPSYVELNWTHVQDTPLQFRTDEGISDCADFVYFTQSIDWPYNEIPSWAEMRFNYSISLTRDFGTELYGARMFEVCVWLIDSSGDWIRLYRSNPPYIDTFWQRSSELGAYEIVSVWRGMVSDSTDPQEDPDDVLTLAVGLSPTHRFENHESSEPWKFYDGSVLVRVSDVDIYVRMELPPDPSTHLEPLFNNTWGMQISEIFPFADGDTADHCYDIETGDDGSVYVVGETGTGYDYYSATKNYFGCEILLKYDSELNLLWSRKNTNTSKGYDVAVHGDFVYTAGDIRTDRTSTERENHDSYVTKWSPGGNLIWSAQWGSFHDQGAAGVAVSADSSVYVLVSEFNFFDPRYEGYYQSAILKYSSAGSLLWNKTMIHGLYALDGNIFVTDSYLVVSYGSAFFSVRDLDGNELWNMTHHGDITVESDHIYITRSAGLGIQIEKWSLEGVNIWNASYSKYLVIGDFETLRGPQLEVGPDQSVFLLIQGYFTRGHYLTKYNSDGSLDWTKSIGTTDWPLPDQRPATMDISSWGIAYFALTPYTKYDFHVYAYQIGEYTLPKPALSLPLPLVIGGGGAAVALVAIVWVYKKRSH